MFKAKAYYILLCLALTACGTENAVSDQTVSATSFFKLEAYFNQEIARLDSIQPVLKKKVMLDGQTEEKRIESTDFEQELQIFRRSDINRPSWSDKYQIDSIQKNGNLQTIRYTAIDTSLNTRLLRVSFMDGEVDEIEIRNQSRSAIASTEQDLLYRPGRNYQIRSKQKTIGADERQVTIEVEIVK